MNRKVHEIPIRAGEILWQKTDDGIVIVSLQAGEVRVLNQLGNSIWQMLDGSHSLQTIEGALIARFQNQVPPIQIQQDLYAFIDELAERGLITWKPAPTGE